MDIMDLIEAHTTYAPTAPDNQPAASSLAERSRVARVEAQAAFDAAMYDGAVV